MNTMSHPLELQLHDASVCWTADLAVGSASMDARNRAMFIELAAVEQKVKSASAGELALWMGTVFDRLAHLLDLEESELAAAGYRELAFHRQLHQRARDRMQMARMQIDKAADAPALASLARETCSMLAIWLTRHIQDADRLFLPYVDRRFQVDSS